MKRSTAKKGATLGAAALTSIVIPTMPSQAQSDQTQVRFLHAVAGAGPASLLVEKGGPRLPSAFAKPSGYQVFRPGQARLRLILNGQSSPVATETVRLGPGRHTVVAVGGDNGVDLLVYRTTASQPGKATLRAIHAAAEVGKADVRVDGKVVRQRRRPRRRHRLPARAPRPPLRGRHAPRRRGRAARRGQGARPWPAPPPAAFVVGSAGMPAQIVLTNDGTAGPVTAPATGLGGATSGGGWLLILGSSLIGGIARRRLLRARRGAPASAAPCRWPRPLVEPAGPPAPSSVAAGPPPVADAPKEEETVARRPPSIEAPAVAAAAVATSPAACPRFRPMPRRPSTVVESDGNGNGHHRRARGGASWTRPPPGARASGPRPRASAGPAAPRRPAASRAGGRGSSRAPAAPSFIRPDDDEATAPAPPSFPRFIRPDPEPEPDRVPAGEAVPADDSDAPEPTAPAPHAAAVRLHAGGRPAAARGPRPLRRGPTGPAPAPYPPGAGSPRPIRSRPRPTSPGPGRGSPSRRPPTSRPPSRPRRSPASPIDATPEPEPVEETVAASPTEVVEAPAPEPRSSRRSSGRAGRRGRRAGIAEPAPADDRRRDPVHDAPRPV